MSFSILQQGSSKRVVLVDLQYPYGKKKVYLSGSLTAFAACCIAAGHVVELVDYNIDQWNSVRVQELFAQAQVIGVSVVGSPYFPQTIAFCQYVAENYPHAKLLLGGQVIRGLSADEFRRIFGKRAIQIATLSDSEPILGVLQSPLSVPLQPVWEKIGDERLLLYLSGREFSLLLSQGCVFGCHFCAADKGVKEEHRPLGVFESDMNYLRSKALEFGLIKLECYASSLDFFQNPEVVAGRLRVLVELFNQDSAAGRIELKVRALCCMKTFLKASRQIPDFASLVKKSGLWCVGFGIDGPNKEVWKQQNKMQNDAHDIVECLDLCQEIGIRSEVLMIMGYPNNTLSHLVATAVDCFRYIWRWRNTVLRPYLAKTLLPGNLGWDIQPQQIEKLIANPRQFYNLDLCALGSPVTHPRMWQRWHANLSFLVVILGSALFGRCASSPLIPQGSRGPVGLMAKLINRYMPFDR